MTELVVHAQSELSNIFFSLNQSQRSMKRSNFDACLPSSRDRVRPSAWFYYYKAEIARKNQPHNEVVHLITSPDLKLIQTGRSPKDQFSHPMENRGFVSVYHLALIPLKQAVRWSYPNPGSCTWSPSLTFFYFHLKAAYLVSYGHIDSRHIYKDIITENGLYGSSLNGSNGCQFPPAITSRSVWDKPYEPTEQTRRMNTAFHTGNTTGIYVYIHIF